MKIIVSQQGKKLAIEFQEDKVADSFTIDKADEFLETLDRVVKVWQRRQRRLKRRRRPKFYYPVDKFLKKHKLNIDFLKKAKLEFSNTGLLTERVIRSIIAGLSFNTA